ncbi:MAG: hypothetical protein PHI29_13030 [Gallionella sp.]|nr:hypothetical protein [Gallionella sp.]
MCQNYSVYSQIQTQLITWAILIVGWFVVHHLTSQREQRKEARERLDQFIIALREIEVRAVEFHQSKTYEADLARTLLFDIQRIFVRLKRYPFGSFVVTPNLPKEMRKAITLRNFDFSKFTRQSPNSEILGDIANAIDKLEDQLEKEYERIYLRQIFRTH